MRASQAGKNECLCLDKKMGFTRERERESGENKELSLSGQGDGVCV